MRNRLLWAANFAVTHFPVDHHTRGSEGLHRMQESVAEGPAQVDLAVHEWTGLIT